MDYILGFILVFLGMLGSLFWFIWVKTSGRSREEQFILRHGSIDEVVDVLLDGSNKPSYTGISYSQYDIDKKSTHLLDEGGWKCNNCGKIMAGYVGTCGCGCGKNETKEDFNLRSRKFSAMQKQEKTTDVPNIDSEIIHNEEKTIELLKKYKELMDEGVITEDEFLRKKKEILG